MIDRCDSCGATGVPLSDGTYTPGWVSPRWCAECHAKLEAAAPKWTTERPTAPGWYWWRERWDRESTQYEAPCPVFVRGDEEEWENWDVRDLWWSKPLTPPPVKKDGLPSADYLK